MTTVATFDERSGPAGLYDRWTELRAGEPAVRARDAADRLGVSEAELVACRCGRNGGVRRLAGPWGDLLKGLPSLGEVMVLTRNDHVVHEKTGTFGKVTVNGAMGLVLNREIDLRVFLGRWASGYAVTEGKPGEERHSLQFFAGDGAAVHKIYFKAGVDTGPYETLVAQFLSDDQTAGQTVAPSMPAESDGPDVAIDAAALRSDWLDLRDVHDFAAMLRRHKSGRVQAMRLVGADLAQRVTRESFTEAIEAASRLDLSIMIFVGSPGVIQIHTGPVKTLKRVGPWFNILDPGFNLHLKDGGIADVWVVRKPTKDGIVTSLEAYDADGGQIALMFGERKEGNSEQEAWRQVVSALETAA
jgi:putative hemin transport protein